MKTLRLSAACLTLLMTGAGVPALAQAFQSTPYVTDAREAALALPRAQPAIPEPRDVAYPGVIQYRADVTDLDRRIISVTGNLPVAGPRPLTPL